MIGPVDGETTARVTDILAFLAADMTPAIYKIENLYS
jgi:hypothetical protein